CALRISRTSSRCESAVSSSANGHGACSLSGSSGSSYARYPASSSCAWASIPSTWPRSSLTSSKLGTLTSTKRSSVCRSLLASRSSDGIGLPSFWPPAGARRALGRGLALGDELPLGRELALGARRTLRMRHAQARNGQLRAHHERG